MFIRLGDPWLPDSCHLVDLPTMTNAKIKKALALPQIIINQFHRADKYSRAQIVLQHRETGEKLTLYTCYGSWRIGGMAWLEDKTNQQKAVEDLKKLLSA